MQFDYLKSLEIEEKINKIRWCQTTNGARLLLSTNDKTIKLWKVHYCDATSVLQQYHVAWACLYLCVLDTVFLREISIQVFLISSCGRMSV